TLVRYESAYREDLVLAYSKCCRPAPPASARARDLGRYPLVLPSAPNTIPVLVDNTCRERTVSFDVIPDAAAEHTILETMSQDSLYTLLPRSALHDIPGRDALICSTITDPIIMNNLTLATPDRQTLPPLVESTANIIRDLNIQRLFA